MVLDIKIIRQNPESIREELKKRFRDPKDIDLFLEVDGEWRTVRFNQDELNRIKNLCSKAIQLKKKAKEADGDSDDLPVEFLKDLQKLTRESLAEFTVTQIKRLSKEIDTEINNCNENRQILENKHQQIISNFPNILHRDVIISSNEDDNGLIRLYGDTSVKKPYSHVDLIEMIDGVNFKMGRRNAGSRCYYLKGKCVRLEQALIMYAQNDVMHDRNYEDLSPPVFMDKDAMQAVAQLSQFDKELYKIMCRRTEEPTDTSEEEKYLIATSEQPIAALHRDSWIPKQELPIRFLGVSECFRQEVGSHGRDTRGIFRVHQFKKVEQFCITSPFDGESDKMFDEMLGNAERFYKGLELPYRVVSIVSGELNNAASIKYDLEGWFPGSAAFRELVSCSNCTDYQSRSLLCRYGETVPQGQDTEYVHMLNCTLAATTRVICAILENYQTPDGIVVPSVLRQYMKCDFIPFVKKL